MALKSIFSMLNMLRSLSHYKLPPNLCPYVTPLATSHISIRLYSMLKVMDFLPDRLAPKCRSCGIILQKEDKDMPGYYLLREENTFKKPKKSLDEAYQLALRNLSREDKELLASNGQSISGEVSLKSIKVEKPNAELECIRCRQVKFHSKFDSNEFPIESPAKIMEKIPPWANLVYVISAQDFPMLLDSKVFEFWPAKQIQFVVTKADLFFENNKSAQDKGLRFFQDYLERTYKVPRDHVFVVSGRVNWGISTLLEQLKDDSFFVGSVNSGKSTLLQSLIYVDHLLKSKAPNAKRERDLQKIEDTLGYKARARQRIKDLCDFKTENGPGVSFMPGFTRNVLPYELSNNKTVFDVPGFSGSESDKLHEILSPSAMKQLQKGVKFHKKGTYKSHYDTIKEGQTLTIGGLFFLTVPRDSMYRIKNMVNHPLYVFRDHEKAVSSWEDCANLPALKDVFLADSCQTNLVKYEIPSFVGSIDLVFKNIGYINVTATGAMPEDMPPIIIYLPRQISACVREPIAKYLMKTLSGRDKNGNPLKKEKWVQLSTVEMKRYVGREPLSKDLIYLGN